VLNVFLTVILPTFIVAGVGAGLRRWRTLDPGALGAVVMYLLSPALVLNGLLTTNLQADISLKIVAAALLTLVPMLIVSFALSAGVRHPRSLQSGYTLATGFPNVGNMGIPISFMAFGDEGLAVAIIIFVVQGTLSWPVGIFVAARGRSRGLAPLYSALKVPTPYAVPVALLIRLSGWSLPVAIGRPIELLAGAAVPVMLIVLGFQLSQGIDWQRWRSLMSSGALRLIASALVAYLVTVLLGLDGVAQQTVIIVAAMPTAVLTTILATEFDAEPKFVSSAVVLSTFASMGTLTVLITLLRTWLG
jgi:predicted permease